MPNRHLQDHIDVGLVVVIIIEQCPMLQYQLVAQEGQRLWCDACRWNYTHVTKDCNHIAQVQREQGYARPQQYRQGEGNVERALVPTYLAGQEQARPVLGAQPPPPGTTPLRYASIETKDKNWSWYQITPTTTKMSSH